MEIEFVVEPEDQIAARASYAQNSDVMRASSRSETLGTASTIIAFFALLTVLLNTYIPVLMGIILALVWVFLWPMMQRSSYHRKQIALYGESKNVTSLGRQVMEFEDDVLTIRSELHWSKIKLPVIERIEITKTHTFMFYGTFQAFVIPEGAVRKGDYKTFVTTLRDRFLELMERSSQEAKTN
jgi:hypothetical protein